MNPDGSNGGIESSAEVELHGLSIYTHHGVSDAEQEIGQRLEFDISFDVPDCDAMFTDRIEDTVDYGQVCDIVALARHRALLPHPRAPRPGRRRAADGALRLRVGPRPRRQAGSRRCRWRSRRSRSRSPRSAPSRTIPTTPPERDPAARPDDVTRTGYLGLGSNVGDSAGHLRAAVALLPRRGVEVEAVSSLYATEPVGEILDQADFLNAALRVRTDLEPEALLDVCKSVEAERGRHFDARRHSPRPLDVDLLLLGGIELATDRLTLPHREVTTRRFVLVPLLELDPDLTLPDGTVLAECLASLPDDEQRVTLRDPL